jgi:hypothetical protein
MPITKENYGGHKDVIIIHFSTGDIMMTKAQEVGKIADNTLCFSEVQGHNIGDVSHDFEDKDINTLPNLSVVMRFDKPESITALIHSLVELQKTVFSNQAVETLKGIPATSFIEGGIVEGAQIDIK